MARQAWSFIPTQTLDDADRADTADAWAAQQRARLADDWRQQQMDRLNEQAGALTAPPAPEQPAGVPPGPFADPYRRYEPALTPEGVAGDRARLGGGTQGPALTPGDVVSGAPAGVADTVGAAAGAVGGQVEAANQQYDQQRRAMGGIAETVRAGQQPTDEQLAQGLDVGLQAAGSVAGGPGPEAETAAGRTASRFFHGSASAFERPEADAFDPNGLFGPGYYVTDDPRVASSYAARRQGEAQMGMGANVRAVDVPAGLNLLDADAPAPPGLIDRIKRQVGTEGAGFDVHEGLDELGADATGQDVWRALAAAGGGEKDYPNAVLQTLGYDGVRYSGGQRIPMRDDAGNPIEHTALAIFGEALPKIRNALSGAEGGQADTRLALDLAGAVGGAAAGQTGTDENTTPGERIGRGVLGATAGLGLSRAAQGRFPASRALGIVDPAAMPAHARDWVRTADSLARDLGLGVLANPASVLAIGAKNAWEIPQRLLAGTVSSLAAGHPREIPQQLRGLVEGLADWVPRFVAGTRAPLTERTVAEGGYAGAAERHDVPVIGGLANLSRQAVRPHIGLTAAFSGTSQDMEIARQAAMAATDSGLTGADRTGRANDLAAWAKQVRDDPRTLDSVPPVFRPKVRAILDAARSAGQRSSYTEPAGPINRAFAGALRSLPVAGQVIAPYTHIPGNVAARALETTPMGIVGTLLDAVRGSYGDLGDTANRVAQVRGTPQAIAGLGPGVSPLAERVSRNLVGTGAVLTGYYLASQGLMTGGNPVNPQAAKLEKQGGLPPDSIVAGGHYVPTFLLGIPGVPLRIGAELWTAQQNRDPVSDTVRLQLEKLAKETPARGLVDLVQALGDPQKWETFIQGQAERWTPGGGLLRSVANATDPSQREVTTVGQAVQSIIPGARNALPVRRTVTGAPIGNPKARLGALNPLAARQDDATDLERMLADRGMALSKPTTATNGTISVALRPDEVARMQELARPELEKRVGALTANPNFANRPAAQQKKLLERAVQQAHEAAGGRFLRSLDRNDLRQRLQAKKAA